MEEKNEKYFLGTDDEELARLGYQHRMWGADCGRLWKKAGFTFGHKILDLGSGPGWASMELSQMVGPSGSIVAFDRSQKYLQYLHKQIESSAIKNIETKHGDAHEMDFPTSSFEGIYARFLFVYLSNPKKVLSDCYRFLKKGGRLAITDLAGFYPYFRVSPHHDIFTKIINATEKGFEMHQANVKVQLDLPQLMTECGFEVREIEPIIRATRPKDLLWNWPPSFFEIHFPKLIQAGLLTSTDEEMFWKVWKERSQDPNSFYINPLIMNTMAIKH